MPLYDYAPKSGKCARCEGRFEVMQRVAEPKLKRYTVAADSGRILHRYFCGDCGCHIYSQREVTPERVVVRAGTIENAPPMRLGAHIWTRSKRPWSYIDPASSQIPGQPD